SDRAAAARRPASAALSLGRTSSPLPPTELHLHRRPEAARRTKPDSSSELELKLEPAILTHFLFDFLSLTRFQDGKIKRERSCFFFFRPTSGEEK
ncbi:hypothetical protein LINPERHAP1_LOCUS15794, partial [Linum perenne]